MLKELFSQIEAIVLAAIILLWLVSTTTIVLELLRGGTGLEQVFHALFHL